MTRWMIALTAPALLLLPGCEEERRVSTPVASAEPTTPGAALDPEMAQAVAAVASASAGPGGALPLSQQGPPPKGVFAPGVADTKIKRGSLPTTELASAGTSALQSFSVQPKPGAKQKLAAKVGFRGGPRQPQLTIDTALEAKVLEAKKAAADAGVTAPGAVTVEVKVTSAKPSASLTGVPKELGDAIGKMKGSKLTYQVGKNGGGWGLKVELSKDAGNLSNIVQRLGEALVGMRVPFPDKQVGAGGLWMANRRYPQAGMDVLHYQMVKLDQVGASGFLLNINGRHYAADASIDLGPAGKDLSPAVEQVRNETQGKVTQALTPEVVVPAGQWESNLQVGMYDTANPQQRMSLQEGVVVVFETPEGKAATPAPTPTPTPTPAPAPAP